MNETNGKNAHMTQADYARYRGVTPSAISQAVKAGKVKLTPDGKVDRAAADAALGAVNVSAELTKARAETERLRAQRARIDLEEKLGNLLDRQDTEAAIEKLGELIVRDLESLPNQADEIAAAAQEGGSKAVRVALRGAVRNTRQIISESLVRGLRPSDEIE